MKQLFTLVSFVALCLCAASAWSFDHEITTLIYDESSSEGSVKKEYVITKQNDSYLVTMTESSKVIQIKTDLDLATYQEHYMSSRGSDEIVVTRDGGKLFFEGKVGSKERESSMKVDGAPWYASKILLRAFVLSGKKEQEFYMSKPEELEAVKLIAVREDLETLDVNGEQIQALRVKFTLNDFRALFWKSYFWYRPDDGILVKSEEVRGGPGTPKVYATLIEERTAGEPLAALTR